MEVAPRERRFLPTPIHPHLFDLQPGDADGFIRFVEHLGINEWLRWLAADRFGADPPDAWRSVIGLYEVEASRLLPHDLLAAAWTDPTTASRYGSDRQHLLDTYRLVAKLGRDAADFVVDLGWQLDTMRIDPHVIEVRGHGVLIEVPADIISRAWWELLDSLSVDGHLPRMCLYCDEPFAPTRANQRYCPGTDHQIRGANKKRNKDPRRREDTPTPCPGQTGTYSRGHALGRRRASTTQGSTKGALMASIRTNIPDDDNHSTMPQG